MKKLFTFSILVATFSFGMVAQKNLVIVRNGATTHEDQTVAAIEAHGGYTITQLKTTVITDADLPVLNAADVVILGRSLPSNDVGTAKAVWDKITRPVLSMNMYGIRATTGKAYWTNAGAATNVVSDPNVVLQANLIGSDPVFGNLTGTIDWWTGYYSVLGADAEADDAGNGTLLIETSDKRPLFIRWAANVEFYSGAGHTPLGERSYIGNGNDNTATVYFGFTDAGKTIFFNELARMAGLSTALPRVKADTGSVLAVEGGIQVNVATTSKVSIYSIDGKMIASKQISGTETIACQKGVYMVRVNDSAVKVMVSK